MLPVWIMFMDNRNRGRMCFLMETHSLDKEISFSGFYYVIDDSGTAVYDSYDNLVGNFETETEAVNMIRAFYGE